MMLGGAGDVGSTVEEPQHVVVSVHVRDAEPVRLSGRAHRWLAVVVASLVAGSAAIWISGLGSSHPHAAAHPAGGRRVGHHEAAAQARPRPRATVVPILMYHVIAAPFPTSPFPGLYVPPAEFAAQMRALASAGYHAVTLDQVRNAFRGTGLLPARPIVISFDNGYRSQYTQALPVLRRLHWIGDENLQLSGLSPRQGGLSPIQIHLLIAAGWELDTQGLSHVDLTGLGAIALHRQVAVRSLIRRRYGVDAKWFCYPSGRYNATVVAAVKAAGYVGATTVSPGWASRTDDPYRLPRLRVLGGTDPRMLLELIAAARNDPHPPPTYPPHV
jgi:peptidoglycan/xylan/chitin deacetylase (PgdA/CDA1 family)